MSSNAALYLRVTLPGGKAHYAKAVYTPNGAIRSQYALIKGQPVRHPEGVYHLRFTLGGKRAWERIGTDASLASTALQRKNLQLQAEGLGLKLPDNAATSPAPSLGDPIISKRVLSEVIAEYLAEIKAHKSAKTLAAYEQTLSAFTRSCEKSYLEDLDRKDVLNYIEALKSKGNVPRTIRNRVDFFQIFLHHFGLPSLLKGSDLPKFTDKKVRSYSAQDLRGLFSHASQDESDILQFFLCTGCREQEVQYACWADIDWEGAIYNVTEKLDLGFKPKDGEEGPIPIPATLVEILRARRSRISKSRLIFPKRDGKADGHMIRVVKTLALKAGLNCGHCVNKSGKSCANHPVCKHFILHKMRKTFATMHHNNGMPARTLMTLLRHSDLEVTLKYIADQHDSETRAIVEGTFANFPPLTEVV